MASIQKAAAEAAAAAAAAADAAKVKAEAEKRQRRRRRYVHSSFFCSSLYLLCNASRPYIPSLDVCVYLCCSQQNAAAEAKAAAAVAKVKAEAAKEAAQKVRSFFIRSFVHVPLLCVLSLSLTFPSFDVCAYLCCSQQKAEAAAEKARVEAEAKAAADVAEVAAKLKADVDAAKVKADAAAVKEARRVRARTRARASSRKRASSKARAAVTARMVENFWRVESLIQRWRHHQVRCIFFYHFFLRPCPSPSSLH
jgi:pyruvate/2-oxoglutarate dehydrogenase complex dihydrolipoamide acyltransferase (E2) component